MFEALPSTSSHPSVLRTVLPVQKEAAGKNSGLQSQTTAGCLHLKEGVMYVYV